MSDDDPIASMTLKESSGLTILEALLSRGQNAKAALARVYPMYQRLQTERFKTEGQSEGMSWPPLNEVYAKYKSRRYGGGPRRKSKKRAAGQWNSYPGKGSKMLIGTGMLAGAAIGGSPGSPFTDGIQNHRALFTDTQMWISVEESGDNPDGQKFDYPHFVSEHRPFMSFSDASIDQMGETISQFILGKD